MIICVCQNVSERDIAKAVANGCHSFPALQEQLNVARCCGACECAARESFTEARACRQASAAQGMAQALAPLGAALQQRI